MILDSNGNIIKNVGTIIGEGSYGKVYVNNDICYKLFKSSYMKPYKPLIEEFMTLDLNNYYKILSILYNENNEFIGYSSNYYQEIDYDLLVLPKDYFISNYYGILKDIKLLSEKRILLDDVYISNSILSKDKIILIDIDEYHFENIDSLKSIYLRNTYIILNLIYLLYTNSLSRFHKEFDYVTGKNIIDNLVNGNIEKELKTSNNIIEYVKKLTK